MASKKRRKQRNSQVITVIFLIVGFIIFSIISSLILHLGAMVIAGPEAKIVYSYGSLAGIFSSFFLTLIFLTPGLKLLQKPLNLKLNENEIKFGNKMSIVLLIVWLPIFILSLFNYRVFTENEIRVNYFVSLTETVVNYDDIQYLTLRLEQLHPTSTRAGRDSSLLSEIIAYTETEGVILETIGTQTFSHEDTLFLLRKVGADKVNLVDFETSLKLMIGRVWRDPADVDFYRSLQLEFD